MKKCTQRTQKNAAPEENRDDGRYRPRHTDRVTHYTRKDVIPHTILITGRDDNVQHIIYIQERSVNIFKIK